MINAAGGSLGISKMAHCLLGMNVLKTRWLKQVLYRVSLLWSCMAYDMVAVFTVCVSSIRGDELLI